MLHVQNALPPAGSMYAACVHYARTFDVIYVRWMGLYSIGREAPELK